MTLRNIFIIILTTLIFLLGCGKEEADVIKIGAILPLTGNASDYGVKSKRGIDFAVTEINSAGGINGKQIQIVYEDDKLEPKDGLNAFNKLSDFDKVPCILGPISSGVVLTVAPEANRRKVVILSTYASNFRITDAGDYIFRIYPSDAAQGVVDAELAIKLNLKNAAIFYVNSDYGVGLRDVFERRYQEMGGHVLAEESFEAGTTDFRTSLNKVKDCNPEVIFMPGNAKEMALILVQAKQIGLNKQFIATDSFLETTVLEIAKDAAYGVLLTTPQENRDSTYQTFTGRYKQTQGNEPGLLESLGYDGMKVLALAISRGGYDSEGIKNALYSIKDYKGVTGEISFDANGDIQKKFVVRKVTDKGFVDFN
jgi:branched-chain amino acid transport system substrate-binding protein